MGRDFAPTRASSRGIRSRRASHHPRVEFAKNRRAICCWATILTKVHGHVEELRKDFSAVEKVAGAADFPKKKQ